MSAITPKADMCDATTDVRFGPKADSCNSKVIAILPRHRGGQLASALFDPFALGQKRTLVVDARSSALDWKQLLFDLGMELTLVTQC
jgi:hypothetical protein